MHQAIPETRNWGVIFQLSFSLIGRNLNSKFLIVFFREQTDQTKINSEEHILRYKYNPQKKKEIILMKKEYGTILVFGLLSFLLCYFSFGDNNQKVQNLRTFAKLYGYVKYFHPSDEAAEINWDQFAVYGIQKVKDAVDKDELKTVLESLFLPVAPTMRIYFKDDKPKKPLNIIPDDVTGLEPAFWQHYGIWLSEQSNIYKSIRLNKDNTEGMKNIFKENPEAGEIIEREIGSGLSCQIPLVLYCGDDGTLGENKNFHHPLAINRQHLAKLKDEI